MSTKDPDTARDAQTEPDASAGFDEECKHQEAPDANQIEESARNRLDRFAAMTREDHPEKYRRKQAMGVTT